MELIIISVFNDGVMEMAHNHLESLVKVGIKNYCAYTTGKKSYDFLKNKGYNIQLIDLAGNTNDSMTFTDKAFGSFSFVRYNVIQRLLEEKKMVWYLDVDTVVLKNITMIKLPNNLDAAFQNDIVSGACTGCMYMRPTEKMLNHIKSIISMNKSEYHDQQILNINLRSLPLDYGMLNAQVFTAGCLFFDDKFLHRPYPQYKAAKDKIKAEKNCMFIHANHIVDNDNKIAALKSENLWFI